ncbi:hypothetical protein DV736_g1460, partial [Chaetothyriales sp. CBS 134916]
MPIAKASALATSAVNVGNYGSEDYEMDVFLSHRNLGDPLLQKATLIIKTKLAGSTILQDAAAKLIKTCSTMSSEHKPSTSVGAQKETAQQIYAIKATDHSLASASQMSPKACNVFCARPPLSWFRKRHLEVIDSDNLNESTMAHHRVACIQELFQVDNLWTSYSNHLQDARTLCEVGSADHAPRAMLEFLGDMAEAVPPVVEMFKDAVIRQQELREQMRKNAEEAEAMHRKRVREEEKLHVASMHRAGEIFGALQRHASQLEISLRTQLLHANEDVDAVSQVLQATMADFWTLRETAALLLQQYLSGFEDMRVLQSKGIEDIEQSLMSSMQNMNLAAGGVLDQFEALSVGVRTGMVDMSNDLENITQRQREVADLQEDSKLQLLQVLSLGQRLNDVVSAIDGKIGGVLLVIEACEGLVQHFSLRGLLAGVGVVGSALLLRFAWCSSAGAIFFLFCVSAAAAPTVWELISPSLIIATSGLFIAASDTTAFVITYATAFGLATSSAATVTLACRLWRRKLAKGEDEELISRQLEKDSVVVAKHKRDNDRSLRAQSAPPDFVRPGTLEKMDSVSLLLRTAIRTFFPTPRHILILDALLLHKVLHLEDLNVLLSAQSKEVRTFLNPLRASRFVIAKLRKQIESAYKADAEAEAQGMNKDWYCHRCKSEYDMMTVLGFEQGEDGFVCEKCGQGLVQDEERIKERGAGREGGGGHRRMKRLNEQLARLDELVSSVDRDVELGKARVHEVIGPDGKGDGGFERAWEERVRVPRADDVTGTGATADRYVDVKKKEKGPDAVRAENLEVRIRTSGELGEEERRHEEERRERIRKQNEMPEWHKASAIGRDTTVIKSEESNGVGVKAEEEGEESTKVDTKQAEMDEQMQHVAGTPMSTNTQDIRPINGVKREFEEDSSEAATPMSLPDTKRAKVETPRMEKTLKMYEQGQG